MSYHALLQGIIPIQGLNLCLLHCRQILQPTPVFLPGEFHGQRSLEGYSPWGLKESDMTEQLTHTAGARGLWQGALHQACPHSRGRSPAGAACAPGYPSALSAPRTSGLAVPQGGPREAAATLCAARWGGVAPAVVATRHGRQPLHPRGLLAGHQQLVFPGAQMQP